uniref:Uncharacterized protein n=1 Tax=Rhizophora mucronata TaxID=61149 RepID=A0A2P2Q6S2_RHIMU
MRALHILQRYSYHIRVQNEGKNENCSSIHLFPLEYNFNSKPFISVTRVTKNYKMVTIYFITVRLWYISSFYGCIGSYIYLKSMNLAGKRQI